MGACAAQRRVPMETYEWESWAAPRAARRPAPRVDARLEPPPIPGAVAAVRAVGVAAEPPAAGVAPESEQLAQLAREMRGPLLALATTAEVLTEEADHLDRAQIAQMALGIR